LARSAKTDYQLSRRAWIVPLAADSVATRTIEREVGCATGTGSK
jgi:hypothetical protein